MGQSPEKSHEMSGKVYFSQSRNSPGAAGGCLALPRSNSGRDDSTLPLGYDDAELPLQMHTNTYTGRMMDKHTNKCSGSSAEGT